MKKIFFLSILAGMLFFGCSQESSDNNPVGPSNESSIKSEEISPFISLPQRDNMSLSKILTSRVEWIGPWKSEKIIIRDGYWSGWSYIRVKMTLEFDKGTVDNYINASAQMDTEVAAFDFFPSPMTFNKPVILNFEISGLTGDDLERFKSVKKFVYLSSNGEMEEMTYDELGVEEESHWGRKSGKFVLKNCKIPHFSRFGFVR